MFDKQIYKETFSTLHASEETLMEVKRMTQGNAKKPQTFRRLSAVLIAAALFLALGVTAYAANLFGIRDAIMSNKIVADYYENGEYIGKTLEEGTTISFQGYIDSPEYEASREFNAFLSAYQTNNYDGDELHQPLGDWGEAHRGIYNGLFTKTLVDKFLEISQEYGLTPWNDMCEGSGYAALCEIIGSSGFLTAENDLQEQHREYMVYRVWDDGSFSCSNIWSADGDAEDCCTIAISRRVKGSMSIDYLSLDNADEYHEWSYTTSRGEEVAVYSGEHMFIALYNGENAFISLNSQPGDSLSDEAIKAYIESIDFSELDRMGSIVWPESGHGEVLPTPGP